MAMSRFINIIYFILVLSISFGIASRSIPWAFKQMGFFYEISWAMIALLFLGAVIANVAYRLLVEKGR